MPSSRPHGDASLLQGTPNRACRDPQTLGYPVRRLTLSVEPGSPIHLVALECPAVPLRDAVASDMAEDRRPVDPERLGELRHRDSSAVGGDQVGHLVGYKAPLDRERGDDRVGRVNRSLAAVLP